MTERFDIAVIGAGVAGASAALSLARHGLRVALIDKAALPRDKVCGCCLSASAAARLRRLGIDPHERWPGAAPLTGVELSAGGHRASIRTRPGLAVSRSALDHALASAAADAGAVFYDRSAARVRPIEHGGHEHGPTGGIAVDLHGPDAPPRLSAALVIAADGLGGSSLAGLPGMRRTTRPRSHRGYGTLLAAGAHGHPLGRVTMRCGAHGYVGAVVLDDGRLDVAAAIDPRYVKSVGGPASAVLAIARDAGDTLPDLADTRWSATAELTGARRCWAPRVLVVGDAAGYVEPFTGEGIGWALAGAAAVAGAAEHAARRGWSDAIGQQWARAYRRAVQRRQWRCRAVASLLRRPALTRNAVRLLSLLSPVDRALPEPLTCPS